MATTETEKHSPGPWQVGAEGELITIEPVADPNIVLAEICGTSPEDQANARVMAAGPDLLKEVKAILDSTDCTHVHTEDCTHDNCAFYRVRAAIRKAEVR